MGDCYYELEVEKVFENHEIRFRGPCSLWKMNLLAVSDRDKTTMFIAVEDTIHVYQLSIDGKPGEPSKILKRPIDSEPSQKHTINAIKVGMIGNEEVLVSVDEAGCVRIWFTANLDKNPIQFSDDESTWGIALHGPKRLLAVSSNSHEITIFNLQKSVQFFSEFDDDDDLDSSEEEEPQTPKTYASVLTKISDNDALGGKAVSVLQGHEHNVPNICFSACGRYLVSCSIDSTCRIWNVKTGELMQTKLLTVDAGDFDLNDSEDWGWTANFVSRSAFKSINTNCGVGRRLVSNSTIAPSSPRSVGTMDSLYQHLRYNLDIQGPNLQGEDLYRIIISRNSRFRNREYEDGYIEDGAYFENDYSTEGESIENDVELESNDDDDDDDDDTEVESDSSSVNSLDEDFEISFHPSQQSSDRERSVMEIEGNATPAYYDRAESATPVVENYTENDPDYRWSVGHELSILSNNDEQNDAPSISEREIEDHNEERPEEIMEEILSQPTQNSTYAAHDSSVQPSHSSRTPVSLSQTVSENMTPVPSHSNPNLSVSPTYNPVSPIYNPTSPTYNLVSPEYIPANRESSPPHLSIVEPIINSLQQESLFHDQNGRNDSLSDEHEVESISQPSSMNIVDTPMEEEYSNTTTRDGETIHSPTSPLSSSFRGIDSPSRDLGLGDELVLYTSKHNLFILDPKSNLKILHTERDVVRKVDLRRFINYDSDRLNMVELIPELSLVIVASQRGKVVLTRIIRIEDDDGNENYYLYPENYLPLQTQMPSPLLGMFVVKHNELQDPALFHYRLYLMYYSGSMFCYEIRREKRTNPLRMDNVLI